MSIKTNTRMEAARAEWNAMADAYEQFCSAPDSYSTAIEWPCIQELLPRLRGKAVLDVGCGTGVFTFLLEEYAPSRLVGLDLSEEMLRIARAKAEARRSMAQFVQGDAGCLPDCVDGPFDLVFSSTTTHYLPDLSALFAGIFRVMAPGGTCILSVIHPVYSAQYPVEHGDAFPADEEWTVRYLDRSRRAYIQPWIEYNDRFENRLSRSYHYTFEDYVQAIVKAGLRIEAVREPMPPQAWKADHPGRYDSFIETPTFLVMRLGK